MAEPVPDWDDTPEECPIDRQPFLARLADAPDDDSKAALLVEAANLLPPWELKRIYARLRKEYGRDSVPPTLARAAVLWQQLKNQEVQRYDTVEYGPCVTLYRVQPRRRSDQGGKRPAPGRTRTRRQRRNDCLRRCRPRTRCRRVRAQFDAPRRSELHFGTKRLCDAQRV